MSASQTPAIGSFSALIGNSNRVGVSRPIASSERGSEIRPQEDSKSILLVTEDEAVTSAVAQVLTMRSFSVVTADNPRSAMERSINQKFDLVLLDASMSRIDGLVILLEIRSRNGVPTIVLTNSEQDCLKAIEAGADDFIQKPFNAGEILVRMQGVLLRRDLLLGGSHHIFQCADLRLNTRTHQVWLKNRPVELTTSEFTILKSLLRTPCRIVSRDELALILYHREATPFERSIDVHVSHLRKKVEQGGGVAIRTMRGVGYLIVPKIETDQV